MKLVYLLACLFLSTAIFGQQESGYIVRLKNDAKVWYFTDDMKDPEKYPLQAQDFSSCHNMVLLDYEVKPVSFTLKNISKTPVKLKKLVTTCPCIELTDKLDGSIIQPGETLTVKLTINGNKLKKGADFSRYILAEVENKENGHVLFTGKVKSMWKYSPSQGVDIGTHRGLIIWKQQFKITSLFDDPNVKLQPPAESKNFVYTFEQTSPKEYTLSVSPRKPLTTSFRHKVSLPVTGVENYNPVEVGIRGRYSPIKFELEKNRFYIEKEIFNTKDSVEVTTNIVERQDTAMNRNFSRRMSEDNAHNNASVSSEEEKAMPMNKVETWKILTERMKVKAPEGITAKITPENTHAVLTLTIPKEALKKDNSDFTVYVNTSGKNHERLAVIFK